MNSDGSHRLCCLILTTGDEAALSRTLDTAAFADRRVIAVAPNRPPLLRAPDAAIPVLPMDGATAAIAAPWTLILFAGETVSTAFAEECRTLCRKESPHDSFAVPIDSYFLNHRMHGRLSAQAETRLLRTEHVPDFLAAQSGNSFIPKSAVAMQTPLRCDRASSIRNLIAHLNDVTSLEMETIAGVMNPGAGRRPFFVLLPAWTFFKIYLGRRCYRDGMYGLLYSAFAAVHALLSAAKKWEYARAAAGATKLPPVSADDLLHVKRLG